MLRNTQASSAAISSPDQIASTLIFRPRGALASRAGRAQFSLGARFFNLFNHPNFYFPVMNVDNTSNFGQILKTVGSPTSIFGSGLSADNSGRIIQLQAKFTF